MLQSLEIMILAYQFTRKLSILEQVSVLLEGLYKTYFGMIEMIFILFVSNIMFAQILSNYDLAHVEELEHLG